MVWRDHCAKSDIDPLDASVDDLLKYLHEKGESTGVSRVYCHLSAISHWYKLKGKPILSDHPKVKMYMKGLKRVNARDRTVKRAKPINIQILNEAVEFLETKPDCLKTWRTVWRMHVSFFCFLRWDDLRRLTREDLVEDHNESGPFFKLNLKYGKTNQLNLPSHRIISSTGGVLCPYRLTQRLMLNYS